MAEQLILSFPFEPGMGEDDFLVSLFNVQAHGMIRRWPDWPEKLLIVCGPEGCGKTHLSRIWARTSKAINISRGDVVPNKVLAFASAPALVIEDMDAACAKEVDEASLFHLLNLARESGMYMLMTARTPPMSWSVNTPDLLSRLRLAPILTIDYPDDTLFRGLVAKLLHDRQLQVDPNVIEYLVLRCERSFAAAKAIVERLDIFSLSRGSRITRAIAAEALKHLDLE